MAVALPPDFLRAIASEFPSDFATTEATELAEYGKDWTKAIAPAPSLVVFPGRRRKCPASAPSRTRCGSRSCPPGMHGPRRRCRRREGRGGRLPRAHATHGSRGHAREHRACAGRAVTQAVHEHTAPSGLTWPVDFASKGSSQVGGNIATNAGGVKVIRYGLTRNWVLGLEVVLADGSVLELNGSLEKNNTGTDLRQLFIGSEGTLGIVTEATLKLTRLPSSLDVFLFAVPDLAGVLALFRHVRTSPVTITAYEFFTDKCLARVKRHRKVDAPFAATSPFYVLLEVEQAEETVLEAFLTGLFERGLASDGAHARRGSGDGAAFWTLREGISESLSATGLPHKNDVALPIRNLEAFCAELDDVFRARYPDWEIALFGHIGDGNLHVNVMKPDAMEKTEFLRLTKAADHDMFTLVKKHGGSISAEHGIGLLKKDYLGYSRSEAELSVLRTLKRALDPNDILNPGKVVDAR
ncbi:MAG: FAD-binding oxidoreductase [Polyangiaceae bacterium]